LNLLLVDSIDFPFGGAHSVHVSMLMRGFKENGENAFLIIPYGEKRKPINSYKLRYGRFDGVPYCFMRYNRKLVKGIRFLDIFTGVFQTATLIYRRNKKKKVDAVILGGIVDIIRDSPIIFTCWMLKVPIYFWLVEKASLNEDYRGIAGFLNYKSQQLSERYLSKFASGLMVISYRLRAHYLKYLSSEKILISPILVSTDIHKSIDWPKYDLIRCKISGEYAGKRMLVYSGSFGEKDGVYTLIEAFSKVVRKYPETVFIMTGKGGAEELMNNIILHINKYQVSDKVKLVGFVDAEELLCYNSIADILMVCRSDSAFANHGFPWKLGEYCMTARPVISTRVSDIDVYFEDKKSLFLAESNTPEAIAEKVGFVFENFELALEVARTGRKVALEKFGYLEKAAEMREFIRRNNPGEGIRV
jgi:glycosyltransferase involved in cell wall biosynthesis